MEVGDWRHDQSKCPLSRPVTGALGGGGSVNGSPSQLQKPRRSSSLGPHQPLP